MVLGLIVEQVSGQQLEPYVRNKVLGPLDWVPVSELVWGRTHPVNRDPREPWYDCEDRCPDVFDDDPDRDDVICSEGGWDHEAKFGHGGMVSSTTMMLHLAENYYISDVTTTGNSDPSYGELTGGVRDDRFHRGNFCGTNSVLQQRSDGINFAVIFNRDGTDVNSPPPPADPILYHQGIQTAINNTINAGGIKWPTQGVDGQWADFNEAAAGEGSFEEPWNDLSLALNGMAYEGTLNIKPGTTDWIGTINQTVRIRAPLNGGVIIGQQ
jgi:hypothetical protein